MLGGITGLGLGNVVGRQYDAPLLGTALGAVLGTGSGIGIEALANYISKRASFTDTKEPLKPLQGFLAGAVPFGIGTVAHQALAGDSPLVSALWSARHPLFLSLLGRQLGSLKGLHKLYKNPVPKGDVAALEKAKRMLRVSTLRGQLSGGAIGGSIATYEHNSPLRMERNMHNLDGLVMGSLLGTGLGAILGNPNNRLLTAALGGVLGAGAGVGGSKLYQHLT